jgi:hypothetical protein
MSIAIAKHLIKTLDCVIVRRKNDPGLNKGRGGNQKKPSNKAYY